MKFVSALALGIVAGASSTASANIESGLSWLEESARADGSIASQVEFATAYQSTARALPLIRDSALVDSARQYLAAEPYDGTEWLVSRILSDVGSPAELADSAEKLRDRQNPDGGFGEAASFQSTVIDTAMALHALVRTNSGVQLDRALAYLLQRQDEESGCWCSANQEVSVIGTATAMQSIWLLRHRYDVQTELERARDWLLAQRDAQGLWGESYPSALAFSAVLLTLQSREETSDGLLQLAGRQLPSGSFGGDVFVTSAVLQTLISAESPHPDSIAINGRVVDAHTRLPVPGVLLTIQGPGSRQVESGADGQFDAAGLTAGRYRLLISKDGYRSHEFVADLEPSQQWSLGEVPLLRDEYAQTGIVRGTIQAQGSGVPVEGATISTSNLGSVISRSDGTYHFVNVPPGEILVHIAAEGFSDRRDVLHVPAGGTAVHSVTLSSEANPASGVSISGAVVNAADGVGLAGATISASGSGVEAQVATQGDGTYVIEGLEPGVLTLRAEAPGYRPFLSQIAASEASRHTFSPQLTAVGESASEAPFDSAQIRGYVVDVRNDRPIPGAQIAVLSAHRYWRLVVTEGNSNSAFFRELEFRAYAGGPDLTNGGRALGMQWQYGGEPANAFDNSASTTWMSPSGLPVWIGYEFAEPTRIAEYLIHGVGNNHAARDWRIEYADEAPDEEGSWSVADVRVDQPQYVHPIYKRVYGLDSPPSASSTNFDGEFVLASIFGRDIEVIVTHPDYDVLRHRVTGGLDGVVELGELRMSPKQQSALLADLVVRSVDVGSATLVDLQTTELNGDVRVEVANVGSVASTETSVELLRGIVDSSGQVSGRPLTEIPVAVPSLAAGESYVATLDVSAVLDFRGQPLTAVVDSIDAVPESNEDNNFASSAAACRRLNAAGNIDLEMQWEWPGGGVTSTPLLGPLQDSNQDGSMDGRDTPVVLVNSYTSTRPDNAAGIIVALDGATGEELWRLDEEPLHAASSPALGDLDGDGFVEIIGHRRAGGTVVWTHDPNNFGRWVVSWTDDIDGHSNGLYKYDSYAVADLDADGQPEILSGKYVWSNDGELLWVGAGAGNGLSVAADLDLDGQLEVVVGATAYDTDGELLWENTEHFDPSYGRSYNAGVANITEGLQPEVVVTAHGAAYLLDPDDGSLIWQTQKTHLDARGGGTPAIGDINGDGQSEIVFSNSKSLAAADSEGGLLWTMDIADGSASNGVSLFDFNADGRLDVVYNDEAAVRVVDGLSGAVIAERAGFSPTTTETAYFADVDGDGSGELLSVTLGGLQIYRNAQDGLLPAPTIWNQLSFHGLNISVDGRVPRRVLAGNQTYDSFHTSLVDNPMGVADATLSRLYAHDYGAGLPVTLSARVGNGGFRSFTGPLDLVFHEGDPSSGASELGRVQVPVLAPGGFADMQLSDIELGSDVSAIYAKVDFDELLLECDETNNSAQFQPLAADPVVELQITTDSSAYLQGATAIFHSVVSNLGRLPADLRFQWQIEDEEGFLVVAFDTVAVEALPSQAQHSQAASWNTGSVRPGSYKVRGRLFQKNGRELARADAGFSVESGSQGATLRASADRQNYHTSDLLQLRFIAGNASDNSDIRGAKIRFSISDSSEQQLHEGEVQLGDVAPGSQRDVISQYPYSSVQEGLYSISAQLIDENGITIASSATEIHIVENLELALSAAVVASQPVLPQRDPQQCTDTLVYSGMGADANLVIRQSVVALADARVVSQVESDLGLSVGVSTRLDRGFSTDEMAPGHYACVLETRIGSVWRTLDNAVFEILPPLVQLSAALSAGDRGRILALVDSAAGPQYVPPTCEHGLWRAQFEGSFASPLEPGAVANVRLLRNGVVVDVESAELGAFAGEVNARIADVPVDLSIPAFDANGLLFELTGENLGSLLGEQYSVLAAIEDRARTLSFHTGLLDVACNSSPVLTHVANSGLRLIGFDGIEDYPASSRFGDGVDTRRASAQRAHVRSLLEDAGWRVTDIDDGADRFFDAFRTGSYDAVLLLAEYVALREDQLKELREAVFNGVGLVSVGRFDERSRVLDHALGVEYLGTHLSPVGLNLSPSALHGGGQAAFNEVSPDDDVQRVRLAGAQGVGVVQSDHAAEHNNIVTSYEYGEGRAVSVGFDLLAESAFVNSPALFDELLLGSLEFVHPQPYPARAGGVSPVRLHLQNLGIAVQGDATLVASPGATIVDSTQGIKVADDTVQWSFALAEDQAADIDLWLQTPPDGSAVSLDAVVQSTYRGLEYPEAELQLTFMPHAAPGLSQAIAELEAILADRRSGEGIIGALLAGVLPTAADKALEHLHRAEQSLASSPQYAVARAELLAATDDLIADGAAELDSVRHATGAALRAVVRQLN